MSWESTFSAWAQGPSQTEKDKCENAERAVRKAIDASPNLSQYNLTVFAQGSYRNRTNIRLESDVDICIRSNDVFFYDIPTDCSKEGFNISDPPYAFRDYKNEIEQALCSYFDWSSVTRGNKAFDVHENTYRVDADVVPTFEYRWYQNPSNPYEYESGTSFNSDYGSLIINWPDQNYDNGVSKNTRTNKRYKRLIRIFKNLRNRMKDDGIPEARNIPSWLIECLLWNAVDGCFSTGNYTSDVRACIGELHEPTQTEAACSEWGEVNEFKYLFRGNQPWTRIQANQFLLATWRYLGF